MLSQQIVPGSVQVGTQTLFEQTEHGVAEQSLSAQQPLALAQVPFSQQVSLVEQLDSNSQV